MTLLLRNVRVAKTRLTNKGPESDVTDFFVPHAWAPCYLKLNGTIIQRPDVTLEINTTWSEFPSNGNDESATDFT